MRSMKIRSAFGLGAFILVLKFLVPTLFTSFVSMTVALFDTLHDIFVASRPNTPPPH